MCTISAVQPARSFPIIVKVIELTFRNYSDRLHKNWFQKLNCGNQGIITDTLYSWGHRFHAQLGVHIIESDFCVFLRFAQKIPGSYLEISQYSFILHPSQSIYLLSYLLTYLLTYFLTYLLTPWNRVLLEKLTGFAASQEIPRIYGTRKFITVLTSARHLFLSWAQSIYLPALNMGPSGAAETLIKYTKIRNITWGSVVVKVPRY
jgi:hypothetical protein